MRSLVGILAVLVAGPAFGQAAEERVTFLSEGQEVVGTLALPEGEPAPVVLLLHGFTGSRDELPIPGTEEGVFSRTARLLAERGYASLRIDFRGSGESLADLTFADTTFEGQVADALAAIDWLQAEPRVAGEDVFVIGWSQGGLVTTAVAGRSGVPDATALWAAVADPEESFGGLIGAEALAGALAMAEGETWTITLPWGAEIDLGRGFFEGVATFDPTAEIAAYAGPLFVAQGTLDTTVLPHAADALIAAHEGPEELWLRDMDHVFNVFTETAMLDAMVAATADFFDAHAD